MPHIGIIDPFIFGAGAPVATSMRFAASPTIHFCASFGGLFRFDDSILAEVFDQFDNPMTDFFDNVTLSIDTNPGGATLSGPLTQAADGFKATFPSFGGDTIGFSLSAGTGYTLKAVSGALNCVSAPFNVTIGAFAFCWP